MRAVRPPFFLLLTLPGRQENENSTQRQRPDSFNADEHVS
jgi:hypothetical protein